MNDGGNEPLRIYYGDMAQSGEVQLLESYFEPDSGKYVPSRMLERVTQAIPLLTARFPTHQSWAEASIEKVMGERGESCGIAKRTGSKLRPC